MGEKIKQKFLKIKGYFFIFLIVLFGISLFRNFVKINQAKLRVEKERQKVRELEQESRLLQEKLSKIQTNEYLEKELRDKLGLAKEKEVVIVLPDSETLKSLVPEIPDEEAYLPDPPYIKWMKLFDIKL